jgi:hypothetical protein
MSLILRRAGACSLILFVLTFAQNGSCAIDPVAQAAYDTAYRPLFGADAWLYTKLPAGAKLYSGTGGASGVEQARALTQALGNNLEPLRVTGETGCADKAGSGECQDNATPLYHSPVRGDAADRVYHITACRGSQAYGLPCDLEGMDVHLPAGAAVSGGAAHAMSVVDRNSGIEIDMSGVGEVQDADGNWVTKPLPENGGDIVIWWGGWAPLSGMNRNNPWTGSPNAPGATQFAGLTASHLAASQGIVQYNDLQAGAIRHVLFMTLPCSSGRAVYPAAGSDSPCSSIPAGDPRYAVAQALMQAPPDYGIRTRLTLTHDQINALPVPAYSKQILTAWADYGAVFSESGSAGWGVAHLPASVQYSSIGKANPWTKWMQQMHASWSGSAYNLAIPAGGLDLAKYLVIVDPCYSVPAGQTVTDEGGHHWTSCR